jgi:hypothetical protein
MNRIIEMHEGGCGLHQIIGVFRDDGIRISETVVSGVIQGYEPLGKKALSKAAAKAAISVHRHDDQGSGADLK